MHRTSRTVLGGMMIGIIAALAWAGGADAHVAVTPDQVSQGGDARIAFTVPTESDTLSTTKVDVYLPTDHPIASVSVEPVPGWSVATRTTKLSTPVTTDDGQVTDVVSQITWTATGDAAIKPGQFQEFPVALGGLPDTGSVTFKVLQTYSDGSVVRWIDLSTPGQAGPDHPAPVLALTKASAPADPGPSAAAGATGSTSSTSGAALDLGIAGLVLGLVGAVLGGLALARTRGRTGTAG